MEANMFEFRNLMKKLDEVKYPGLLICNLTVFDI